ncbi:hypothetical protein ZEAMMB73_Zm00001d038278 [Zea mays]|uniref:ABC transporter domain-containing protein n=1 Tax=Zea mays TaxID=4577 RepID=A0A1D6M514_MAIZE|nr:hypothetical protein ZEAMMB73_Zm00001d038278 [Zea mays]
MMFETCSCALQLWVGRHLIHHGKSDGGEVVVALFSVILSGLYLSRPEIPILSGFFLTVPTRKTVALVGEVLLHGENIKKLKVEWLRSQIGLIEEAAKTTHAHGFISSLEKGDETQVGRAGLTLTDEHKIKISIARVVLSNPSIILLDEVTGGLDFEAEKAVQEALDVLMLGRSTIIIARRLCLIKNADYIAVME